MMKKNIAKLLVFAMLLSMLPFAAAAADGQVTPQANDTGAYVIIGDVTVNSQTLSNPTVNDSTYAFTGDVKAVVGTELTIILNAEASDNSQVSVYKVGADSSNLELLTNKTDTVTPAAAGELTLTYQAMLGSNANATKTITVTFHVADSTVAVESVAVEPKTLSLKVGETGTLTATVAPENATNKTVTWTSNKTDIATVSDKGVVTAVAAGEATITVTTEDGSKTAECTVTVTPGIVAVTGVTLDKETLSSSWNQDILVYQTLNENSASGLYDKSGFSMNMFLKIRDYLIKEADLF